MGIADFLRRWLGGGDKASAPPTYDSTEYQGYRITPAPERQGGQWLTAGAIEKDFPEGTRTHRFIRADIHHSADDAAAFAVTKAKQIIDQEGDRMFERERA